MDTDLGDGLADDLVLDVPAPHDQMTSRSHVEPFNTVRSRAQRETEAGKTATATSEYDGAAWYGRFGADDSDSVDDDHSHDLTYLAGRASVMDSMLLSLDQLEPSTGLPRNASQRPQSQHNHSQSYDQTTMSEYSLDGSASAPRWTKQNPSRRRNHGHSSSYSSDYSLTYEGTPGRRMQNRARGESGSSATTFQVPHRKGSKAPIAINDAQGKRYNGDSSSSAMRTHTRGARTKGNKGSNSSSFDMGRSNLASTGASIRSGHAGPAGLAPWGIARRTASTDRLPYVECNDASSMPPPPRPVHPSTYDFYDAAPTPTVLQGPRKKSSITFGQPSPVLGQVQHSPLLGSSSRPSTSSRIRKSKSELPDPSVFRLQANEFVDSTNMQNEGILPGRAAEYAIPSPSQPTQKGWQSVSAPSAVAPLTASKERPNFFRRYFRSSKPGAAPVQSINQTRHPSSQEGSHSFDVSPQQQPQQQQHKTSFGQIHISSQMRSHAPTGNEGLGLDTTDEREQPKPSLPTIPTTPSTPVITKKPSSFFRRRKKSVSDAIRNNSVAIGNTVTDHKGDDSSTRIQPLHNVDVNFTRQHTSISSLRQVMNPYLGESDKPDPYIEQPENQRKHTNIDKLRDGSVGGNNGPGSLAQLRHNSPSTNAITIRAVNSNDVIPGLAIRDRNTDWIATYLGSEMAESIHAASARDLDSATTNKFKLKMKGRTNSSAVGSGLEDNSFFTENSSAEASDQEILAYLDRGIAGSALDSRLRPLTSPSHPRARNQPRSVPFDSCLSTGGNEGQFELHDSKKLQNGTGWVASSETSLADPQSATSDRASIAAAFASASASSAAAAPTTTQKPNRVWLHPDSSDEHLEEPSRAPPPPPVSTEQTPKFSSSKSSPSVNDSAFQSATSLPGVRSAADVADQSKEKAIVEKSEIQPTEGDLDVDADVDPLWDVEPTPEDRARAQQIFDGSDEFASKEDRAMTFLGDGDSTSVRVRKAYMELFDWNSVNILTALRGLCAKLLLRGESQQMDRVLDAFSHRWCECNPTHGFKARDVVHTISYSILLLNTDLHMANIEHKMTRAQFVKNTLPTIKRVVVDAVPDCWDDTIKIAPTQRKKSIPWQTSYSGGTPGSAAESCPPSPSFAPSAPSDANASADERPSLDMSRGRKRLSVRAPLTRNDSETHGSSSADPIDNCNVLVRFPYDGPLQGWETHLDIILKAFYDSIRRQPLPLHGSNAGTSGANPSSSLLTPGCGGNEVASSNLSVMTSSILRRTPSVLSKTPSESISQRGGASSTFSDFRSGGFRWASKSRSRPRVYHSSTMGSSSRTSLDDHSPWSPAGSSTWSRISHSRTQPTTSVDSFRSHFTQPPEFQKSIGFANALSQAIIREEGMASAAALAADGVDSSADDLISRTAPLLDDETLELAGAPWAKEGMLKHKHHLEALDKRAKDRTWTECFAVVEKGYMKLFSFGGKNSTSSTMKLRPSRAPRARRAASASNAGGAGGGGAGTGGNAAGSGTTTVVGGGNWSSNASVVGSFLLRQTIASALPPPGYSKTRPHVWALSLPTGAVHLFQAGTLDIVREFVSTVNYWSARLSKEPLVGGVSNIEYGWSESVINAVAGGGGEPRFDGPPAANSSLYSARLGSSAGPGAGSKVSLSLPCRPPSSSATAAHSSSARPMSPSSTFSAVHRPSLHGSIRSSVDQGLSGSGVGGGSNSAKTRHPGDKISISDWMPPTQSMLASQLMEVDQLRALRSYVKSIEEELSKHNELRGWLSVAVSLHFSRLTSRLYHNSWFTDDANMICSILHAIPTTGVPMPIGKGSLPICYARLSSLAHTLTL